MSSVPNQIAGKFFAELAKKEEVSSEQIEALRALMEKGTKLKAVDVEAVFKPPEDAKL